MRRPDLWQQAGGDGKFDAGSLLTFDKYGGDQVLGLQFEQAGNKRTAGLHIWDQPDATGPELEAKRAEARKLDPGPAKDALLQETRASQRIFIGRSLDKSAAITLYDGNSRPRIRIVSPQSGEPRLEFLDVHGKVIQALP